MQEQMREKLEQTGLPYKDIKVYGRQIMVTAWSRKAADDWAALIGKFATLRAVVEDMDEAHKNEGTSLNPTNVNVWRVAARI